MGERSEAFQAMSQRSRMAGALTLIQLADRLAGMTADELVVEGLHIAAEASGWCTEEEIDAALKRLGEPNEVIVWLTERFTTVTTVYRQIDEL